MPKELPHSRLVEIPDGAHELTVEQPTALRQAVDEFLTAG
jgi:pimeloyl-ACP methyl ester carboxylesterase